MTKAALNDVVGLRVSGFAASFSFKFIMGAQGGLIRGSVGSQSPARPCFGVALVPTPSPQGLLP